MSKSIDERIVQMKFDNKQFETGVKTSVDSLNNLKKGLNLEESAKGLSNLQKVGKNFTLEGIAAGVDTISSKFTNLGIMGVTALANITNSALNAGKRLVASLTVDPIKMGLDEYETKMGAITTILTNTQSKGTTLSQVNETLNELNTYADKTIYNFAEMTRNIGTFTAAGVDLKTSATAIKGIANLAAGSGSNAQQASTAMYQLSQAMASGTVKLQDWNSVVNAGMGGELFQKALEKTAKELGHGRDMSVSFRESLEKGWITTDVLTKTLEKFAADESLLKAATQVKTFTQLLDTMKESVQSGWAQSWESIIGDKEEAATLFTAINDGFGSIVGASAEARNAMLLFWSDNGGRTAIIEALSNAFKGLQSILKPIGEAFREIFPAMTGQRLIEISKSIRDLTANFKIGEETSTNLKRTFKGLFAIFDIGKQAFFAIAGGLADLIGYLIPASGGILNLTGSIGDFLVSLDESIKKSGIFTTAVKKISDFIKIVADNVRASMNKIVEAFTIFSDVDLSGLDSFSERVKARFEPFTKLGDFTKEIFSKMAATVERVAPVFYKLASLIGGAFDKMRTNIIGALDNAEFNSVFDIVNGGIFAGILLGIKSFIKSLTEITDGAGGTLGSITGILDGVKGSLEAYQNQLKSKTLLTIAGAIGILAASLVALSLIDSGKLTSALTAMSVMFGELFISMGVFEKIMAGAGFKSMGKVTRSMILLSTAILILSVAMEKLAKLDWNGIAKGLTSVAALSAILVASTKVLSTTSGKMMKGALGLILFAAAINVLAEAVKKLSDLSVAELTKGLVGVGVLCAELVLFMKAADMDKMGVLKGTGILILAGAITVLAGAVKSFGELDTGAMVQGLIGVGTVLTELAIFTNVTGNAKNVISTAIGLTILGAAMLIFSKAIGEMGSLKWEEIGKGLVTMAGALTIISVAMKLMPNNMVLTGTGLLVVATSLVILAKALTDMSGMSWEEIAKGLVTLAGSLTVISIAMAAMTGALPGAAALLVVAGALAILAPVLVTLGSMSLSEIGKGLLALAGVFGVIAVSGMLLAPLTPVILGLSAAIALFGVGCLAVGAGILAFSAGITALAVAGTAGSAALVLAVTSIVGLIPFVLKTLAEGVVEFVKVIGDSAIVLVDAVSKVLIAVLNKIIELTPKIVDTGIVLVTQFLRAIVDFIPKLVDAGMKILVGFLDGIANNIGQVVASAVNIIVNFLEAIGRETPRVVDAGFNMIVSFINGLSDSIRNNTPIVRDAMWNLIDAMIDGFLGIDTQFADIGKNMMQGLANGIKSMAKSIVSATKGVVNDAVQGAKNLLGIHSPSRVFAEMGMYMDEGMANGLSKFSHLVSGASEGVGNTAVNSLSGVLSNLSNIVSGNIDMNPTIRPVLDLGGVTSGVGVMDSLFNKTRGISVSGSVDRASYATSSLRTNSGFGQNGSGKTGSSSTDVGGDTAPIYVTVVSQLDGREIARVTAPAMSEELYNIGRRKIW